MAAAGVFNRSSGSKAPVETLETAPSAYAEKRVEHNVHGAAERGIVATDK
jgi:hypothetical protein